ncbi:MAG TPA: inositol monophosphatase family protein [Vicinamibacteria bacterium]|nr:inositol monophosphatase family protein [Vicinamibacteria bacterium]
MPPVDVERAMDTARHAVLAASAASLRYWRKGVVIDTKPDRSPVTAADRDAEAAILDVIHLAFPHHAVLAEESGETKGEGGRWIVDPLDGTRGFTRGGSFWGPLVALEVEGDIVAGAIGLPALGETYFAGRGLGAFRDGERLAVSNVGEWSEATLQLGELKAMLAGSRAPGVRSLVAGAASTRGYGDLAGCVEVLSGRADAWLEAGVRPWDIAALKVLVEEAGGRFTDFDGGARYLETGHAVASNSLLHAHVLRALAGSGP